MNSKTTAVSKPTVAASYKVESDIEESNLEKTLNELARQGYAIEIFLNRSSLYTLVAYK